jgi:hypothetical protein
VRMPWIGLVGVPVVWVCVVEGFFMHASHAGTLRFQPTTCCDIFLFRALFGRSEQCRHTTHTRSRSLTAESKHSAARDRDSPAERKCSRRLPRTPSTATDGSIVRSFPEDFACCIPPSSLSRSCRCIRAAVLLVVLVVNGHSSN